MTERLSDPQFYFLMTVVLALGLAGLITVIVWPLEPRRVDRGGFIVADRCGNEDLANCSSSEMPSGETWTAAGRLVRHSRGGGTPGEGAQVAAPPSALSSFFRRAL
jgi:hypothetical protein